MGVCCSSLLSLLLVLLQPLLLAHKYSSCCGLVECLCACYEVGSLGLCSPLLESLQRKGECL